MMDFFSFYGSIKTQIPQQCVNTLRRGQSNQDRLTMTILPFDEEKYFLGILCKREHDWENTRRSLRRKTTKVCLKCQAVASKKYRCNNPEKAKESSDKYKKANPEVVKRTAQKAREEGRAKANAKRWRENHPEYKPTHAEKERIRRFKKKSSRTEDYTIEQLKDRFSEFGNCCAYCKSTNQLTSDHFIPIKTGGSDCIKNIVPACKSCNSSKQASEALTWYKKQTFYCKKQWRFIVSILEKE